MISDDRLNKTRFCKKKGRGLTKTFLIKKGVGAKGGLERFCILRRGGVWPKRGGDFFRGGGSYPGAHYVILCQKVAIKTLPAEIYSFKVNNGNGEQSVKSV